MIIPKNLNGSYERKQQKIQDTAWANAVKERDGWACVICGCLYAPNAHHIIPRENKEFRYCLDNGITLCVKHHKFSRIISAHNSPFAFFLWLQRFRPLLAQAAIERVNGMLLKEGINVNMEKTNL